MLRLVSALALAATSLFGVAGCADLARPHQITIVAEPMPSPKAPEPDRAPTPAAGGAQEAPGKGG